MRNSPIFEFLASHRYIVTIIVTSVIGCILECISRVANEHTVRKPAEKVGGWCYLKYGWLCRSAAIFGGLFFGTILYITYSTPTYATSRQRMLGARLVFGGILILCIFSMYECFIRVVRFNSAVVESRHPFGTWQMAIGDISDVNFYPSMDLVRLISRGGARLWLPSVRGTEQFCRYLRRKQRLQVLKDISIKKLNELKSTAEWQTVIDISEKLQSEGLSDRDLLNNGASLVTVPHEGAWVWEPEMGNKVKTTLLSGEAYLCVREHDFILQEGDTISLLTSVPEPFAVVNISGNYVRLLVVDLEAVSARTVIT